MTEVTCPRPGHDRSRIVRDGLYGAPGHRRQMYRCSPANGERPHRFAPVLPRLCAHDGVRCLECEHVLARDEGPQVPRTYLYSARDIAEALRTVGAGQSYREATARIRVPAQRERPDGTRHGQVLGDWTEVFAPLLWERLGPRVMPERLICDSTPFYVTPKGARRHGRGRSRTSSVKAFEVCCVVGQGAPDHKPKLLALVAVPSVNQAAWEEVLRRLPPGRPLSVLSDEDNSLANAVANVWPQDRATGEATPDVLMCVWHLARSYRTKGAPLVQRENPDHPVWKALEKAFVSPEAWREFCAVARQDGGVRADKWLRRLNREQRVAQQLATTPPEAPRSNRAAEAHLVWLRSVWAGRFANYRNAERTNRLLGLYVLHRRGGDDPRRYSLEIRRYLGRRSGVAPKPRQVVDHGASPHVAGPVKPSLRA